MARICHAVLIGVLLVSSFHRSCVADYWDDFSRDLTRSTANIGEQVQSYVSRLTQNINNNVQRQLAEVSKTVENLPREIEHDVWSSLGPALAEVRETIENLPREIEHDVRSSLEPALAEVRETIENLPRDANGQIITNSGSTIIFNRDGVSRSIVSGLTPEGEPYMRDVVERYDGNMLYHNETIYNPKTKIKETFCWKLDLSKPGASREAIDSC